MKFKLFIISVGLFYLFSCSESTSGREKSRVIKHNKISSKEPNSIHRLIEKYNDNSKFIGFVEKCYFDKGDDFYVELYFKDDKIDEDECQHIIEMGDSIIYEDDENKRTRIPFEVAEKYFLLSGLEPLYIYNLEHKLITTCHIKRVEYLDQNISSGFIGVIETNKLSKKESYYCIGNEKAYSPSRYYRSYEDEDLTGKFLQLLDTTGNREFNFTHYKNSTSNFSISLLNTDSISYLLESIDTIQSVIYKSDESENIDKLIFLPIIINNRPVLLTGSHFPEGDDSWSSVLVFDGKRYKIQDRQRINR